MSRDIRGPRILILKSVVLLSEETYTVFSLEVCQGVLITSRGRERSRKQPMACTLMECPLFWI